MKVKLSELKLDYSVYPREKIERYHVRELVEALEAGVVFPQIIIERKSKRVVDGFHRLEAFKQHLGKDARVDVEGRDYADDAAFFADAIRLNASHGRALSIVDKAHCLATGSQLNMTLDKVSQLLNMTPERAQEMKAERFATYSMKPVALKRTMAHLAGRELSDDEFEANRRAGGLPQTFYINQVIALIESDVLDWENERVMSRLRHLYQILGKLTSKVA